MTAVAIRPLALGDLDQALGLSTSAGWNQQIDDWRVFLQIASSGAFAAVADGRVVGTAIGVDYVGFAWIAMMLVDPAYRGRGVGGRLLQAALAAVPADLPVRLDATPLGRPLYRRFGFEDETTLRRFVATGLSAPPVEARAAQPMAMADLRAATERDREIFGGTRAPVLEWAFQSAPHCAHVVRAPDHAIQYCFGRRGRLFDQIGPVVAGDATVAHALVQAACAAADGQPVAVDAFDLRTAFTAALRKQGFVAQRPFFRMHRGLVRRSPQSEGGSVHRTAEREGGEYAILGPDFG